MFMFYERDPISCDIIAAAHVQNLGYANGLNCGVIAMVTVIALS